MLKKIYIFNAFLLGVGILLGVDPSLNGTFNFLFYFVSPFMWFSSRAGEYVDNKEHRVIGSNVNLIQYLLENRDTLNRHKH